MATTRKLLTLKDVKKIIKSYYKLKPHQKIETFRAHDLNLKDSIGNYYIINNNHYLFEIDMRMS